MVALPAAGSFLTGAGSNESRGLLFEDWLAFIRAMPGGAAEATTTIAAGSATPTAAFMQVDTEGQAASDDLDFLTSTGWPNGTLVWIRSVDAGRVVNVRHARGTTNQIFLSDAATLSLISPSMRLLLMRTGTQWLEVFRDFGNQHAAYRTWRGMASSGTWVEASTAEAQAGTAADRLMTPRRVTDALGTAALMIGNRTSTTSRQSGDEILIKRGTALLRMTLVSLLDVLGLNRWDSGDLPIGVSQGGAYAHNLGGEPVSVEAILRNTVAEIGYNPNDCIRLDNNVHGGVAKGVSIWYNSSQVGYRCTDVSQPVAIFDRNSGALSPITSGRWVVNIRAWR